MGEDSGHEDGGEDSGHEEGGQDSGHEEGGQDSGHEEDGEYLWLVSSRCATRLEAAARLLPAL